MLNPSGDELDDLQRRTHGSPGAKAAFDVYITAVAKRDELIEEKQDTKHIEAKIEIAREKLGCLIGESK